jgi:transposase InsO family protein
LANVLDTLPNGFPPTESGVKIYVDLLLMHSFKISMARKGNPYDNAAAKSFIKTLKNEEVYLWKYRTLENIQIRLPFFILEVYSCKSLHSALGYRPPLEFEKMFLNQTPCPTALTGTF